jgi:hypothetical protein
MPQVQTMRTQRRSHFVNNRPLAGSARIVLIATLGLAPILGCATSSSPDSSPNQRQVIANFDLSKCANQGGGLYKCPAIDKPICDSNYSGDVECVKIGKKGSVFVMGPTETP